MYRDVSLGSSAYWTFLNTFTGRKGVKTKVKVSLQEFHRQGRGNNTRTSGVWCSFQRSWVSQWRGLESLKYWNILENEFHVQYKTYMWHNGMVYFACEVCWKAFVMISKVEKEEIKGDFNMLRISLPFSRLKWKLPCSIIDIPVFCFVFFFDKFSVQWSIILVDEWENSIT